PLTRPTGDRVRESLFNVLGNLLGERDLSYASCRFLDAFAGSGALGLEAYSRGVPEGAFIEQNVTAFSTLLLNLQSIGAAHLKAYRRDTCDPGKPHGTFNLIFLDPPYGKGLVRRALRALQRNQWIDEKAILVVEMGAEEEAAPLDGYVCLDRRVYGAAQLLFYSNGVEDASS
ncbi:MAG: 16S rRNA (guanine(966)-N(2))-methyltransferase RsmD, partial [Alphaproteobacteria bacterium]|nr:16S rRNA (guanine(966)-N(2))-methyltransferase RsmD [Alphaproteobacteria bacterium]